MMDDKNVEKIKVKIRLPKNLINFMDELIKRGYYASRSEIIRVALIDLIIEKFDIDIDDLEPDILEEEEEKEEEVVKAKDPRLRALQEEMGFIKPEPLEKVEEEEEKEEE